MSCRSSGALVALFMLVPMHSSWGADDAEGPRPRVAQSDQKDLDRRTRLLIGAGVGATYLYGLKSWWGDGFGGGFKAEREGWFGRDTEHGGQDKLGHYMFTYAGARLLTWGLESLGHDREKAIWLGAGTAFVALSGIEVIDGFSKKWSFSPEDFLMNTAGAAAAILLEQNPKLDRMFDFRIH